MSEVIRSSTLSTALSDGDYVSFTFTPTASVDFQGFTFDIPAQGIAAGTSYVLFSDQKAFTSGNEIGSISTPDNGAYTDQTISLSSMSSASSATEFRLYMWSDGSFDKGVYGLDNFELTAVPEPATLGMVGFAGLAMLLLRRRMCK